MLKKTPEPKGLLMDQWNPLRQGGQLNEGYDQIKSNQNIYSHYQNTY
jgi:hypothetical protein